MKIRDIYGQLKLKYLLLKGRFTGRRYIIITLNIYKCYNECYKYGNKPTIDDIVFYTGLKREIIEKIQVKQKQIDLIFRANEKARCVLYEIKQPKRDREKEV